MKDIFNQISEQVMSVTEEIGKQTEKVVETQKLKTQLRKIKMDRNHELEKIGRLYFEMYKNGELNDPKFEEYFVNVKDKEIVIKYLENKLIKYQDKMRCTNCDAVMGTDFQFCPQCGNVVDLFEGADTDTDTDLDSDGDIDTKEDIFVDEDKNTTTVDKENTEVVDVDQFVNQLEADEE